VTPVIEKVKPVEIKKEDSIELVTPVTTSKNEPLTSINENDPPIKTGKEEPAEPVITSNILMNEIINFFRNEIDKKDAYYTKSDELKNKIITEKDRIITEKEKIITEKDLYIKELTEQITDFTNNLGELFKNSQQLQQNQQVLEAKTMENENNNFIDNSEKKKGFFKKRFGKK